MWSHFSLLGTLLLLLSLLPTTLIASSVFTFSLTSGICCFFASKTPSFPVLFVPHWIKLQAFLELSPSLHFLHLCHFTSIANFTHRHLWSLHHISVWNRNSPPFISLFIFISSTLFLFSSYFLIGSHLFSNKTKFPKKEKKNSHLSS